MSAPVNSELLSAFDKLFAKYFNEKGCPEKGKEPKEIFYETYLQAARNEDEVRPKDWEGNTGSILSFTGLFAATVAAFVIESYKLLQPDPSNQTIELLAQILAATKNTSCVSASPGSSPEPFEAPVAAIIVNVLWFVSLVVALACALIATLMQQWARDYVRDIERGTIDESAALIRAYVRMGFDRYGVDKAVYAVVGLIHLAVMLFIAGLIIFLFPVNSFVAWALVTVSAFFMLAYLVTSMIPLYDNSCPYKSIPTHISACFYWLLMQAISIIGLGCVRLLNSVLVFCTNGTHLHHCVRWGTNVWEKLARLKLYFIQLTPVYPISWRNHTNRRRKFRRGIDDSLERFVHLWDYASRQMLSSNRDGADSTLETLLQAAMQILESKYLGATTRMDCMAHIICDTELVHRLHTVYAPDLPVLPWSSKSESHVACLKVVCLLLQNAITGKDHIWEMRTDLTGGESRELPLITIFCIVRYLLTDAAGLGRTANSCLFRLRWALLLMIREDGNSSDPDVEVAKAISTFFKERSRVRGLSPISERNYEIFDKPRALLYLLNSWQFNTMDMTRSSGRNVDRDWNKDTGSCLVPLHDGDCCRSRDGPVEHIAACTMLTTILDMLHVETKRDEASSAATQDHGNIGLPQLNRDSILPSWETLFQMNDRNRKRAPSGEFLTLLRNVGLECWLQPGSDFSLPPSTTQQGCFLSLTVASFFAETVGESLRALARQVDMSIAWVGSMGVPASSSEVQPRDLVFIANTSTAQSAVSKDVQFQFQSTYHNGKMEGRHSHGSLELEEVVVEDENPRTRCSSEFADGPPEGE